MRYVTTIGEKEFLVEILDERRVKVDGKVYDVDFNALTEQPVYSLLVDGRSYEAYVNPVEEAWHVMMFGRFYPALVEDEREKRLRAATSSKVAKGGDFHLKAPMPGLVVDIPVQDGQQVAEGDILIVLESMKMQIELRCPQDGVIQDVHVAAHDHVTQGQTLVTLAQSSKTKLSERKNGSNGALKKRKEHVVPTNTTTTTHS